MAENIAGMGVVNIILSNNYCDFLFHGGFQGTVSFDGFANNYFVTDTVL